jgi:RNA polymerase primary sigma factor
LVREKGDAALSRTASRSSRQSADHHQPRGGRLDSRSGRHADRPAAEEPFEESFDDREGEGEAPPLTEDEIDEVLDDEPDAAHTGEDDQIDDPVRIYLMQMGEIPMLSRWEEKSVARRIVRSRRRFRCCMLASDYILHAAKGLLEGVRDNKLRLDRTMEVSVVNVGEKSRLLKVLTPNLRTLDH